MTVNLQTLKTELNTDPNGYGYAALLGDNFNPPELAFWIAAEVNGESVRVSPVRSLNDRK